MANSPSRALLLFSNSLSTLAIYVDLGYPQGAPLQVNCVRVPLVGTLGSLLLLLSPCSPLPTN
jgi:hypothetical protein